MYEKKATDSYVINLLLFSISQNHVNYHSLADWVAKAGGIPAAVTSCFKPSLQGRPDGIVSSCSGLRITAIGANSSPDDRRNSTFYFLLLNRETLNFKWNNVQVPETLLPFITWVLHTNPVTAKTFIRYLTGHFAFARSPNTLVLLDRRRE